MATTHSYKALSQCKIYYATAHKNRFRQALHYYFNHFYNTESVRVYPHILFSTSAMPIQACHVANVPHAFHPPCETVITRHGHQARRAMTRNYQCAFHCQRQARWPESCWPPLSSHCHVALAYPTSPTARRTRAVNEPAGAGACRGGGNQDTPPHTYSIKSRTHTVLLRVLHTVLPTYFQTAVNAELPYGYV